MKTVAEKPREWSYSERDHYGTTLEQSSDAERAPLKRDSKCSFHVHWEKQEKKTPLNVYNNLRQN